MSISEQQLLNLKRKASEVRDNAIQAKATMKEVVASIENYKNELRELGVRDLDNVDNEIAELEGKIEEIYKEAMDKLKDFI